MNTIEYIENKAISYERSKMMRNDSEVEIDILDQGIYLCDYSTSREGAEIVEKLCSINDINKNQLIALCDKHNWSYVV